MNYEENNYMYHYILQAEFYIEGQEIFWPKIWSDSLNGIKTLIHFQNWN